MRKRQREWREKKRKNWSEQQTQNCTLSRSKAFALTYQCISQRWSMWFVDNLSKIIFQKTICYMRRFIRCWYAFTLTEYKTCNHWFFPDKSALQWFLLNSLHAELIFVNAAIASGSVIFLVVVYFFPENNNFFCAQSSVQIWSVIFLTSIISVPIGVRSISNQIMQ